MCNPASFVINKNYKVFWSMKTDSHSEIITEFGLTESIANHAPETMKICLAKVEITPPDGDMRKPIDEWEFNDRDDQQPEWYDRAKAEKAARLALADWHKARVITVTPDHPLKDGKFWVYGTSQVEAWDSSQVEAWDSSKVEARDYSKVVAMGSSQVVARGYSQVVAWDSIQVEAWDSSQVEARDSSKVEARDSSQVEAMGSSKVVARGSSKVVAMGSSKVEAWDSSQVEARGYSTINSYSNVATKTKEQAVWIDRTQEPPVITCGWIKKGDK